MVYKLDPNNRSEDFSALAYELYLKKMHKGKESIKTVKIATKEVPGGKTVEELEEMGFLSSGEDVPSPLISDERKGYDPLRIFPESQVSTTELTPIRQEIESSIAEEVSSPIESRIAIEPIETDAKRAFWFKGNISSEVAKNIDYIKWRRHRVKKEIVPWLKEKANASSLFTGGVSTLYYFNSISNIELRMNSFEIKHENPLISGEDSILYKYEFNGNYSEQDQYSAVPANVLEDRLSSFIYHLSVKWMPEVEKWYIQNCGRVKRYGIGTPLKKTPEVDDKYAYSLKPSLRITFVNETFDGISGVSDDDGTALAFVMPTERMHFDLLDYFDKDNNKEFNHHDRSTINKEVDLTAHHELFHYWSLDGFDRNTSNFFGVGKKVLSEGFAELFSGGYFRILMSYVEDELYNIFGPPDKEKVINFLISDVDYKPHIENAFSSSNFSYMGGGAACLFLAKRMWDKNKYILDFYKELNKKLVDKSFDEIFLEYSGYHDIDEWKQDFLSNWAEVFCDLVIANHNSPDRSIWTVDNKLIGGPGGPKTYEERIPDVGELQRTDPNGQNIFGGAAGTVERFIGGRIKKHYKEMSDEENQLVYICEDVRASNEENFKKMLSIAESILEVYCIVMTDQAPGSTTSSGIKVYSDGMINGAQSNPPTKWEPIKVKNKKTLYMMGVSYPVNEQTKSHLTQVLEMIPNTVKYVDSPRTMAMGNLLINQTLT